MNGGVEEGHGLAELIIDRKRAGHARSRLIDRKDKPGGTSRRENGRRAVLIDRDIHLCDADLSFSGAIRRVPQDPALQTPPVFVDTPQSSLRLCYP